MSSEKGTIVLIHGLWMPPLSWEDWNSRFTEKGYRVIAKAWPGLEGNIEDLRRDPTSYASLGISEIVDHYETIIRGLDAPPFIIGHSFGGLITQILVDRNLGAAGVAIAPAPVKGIYFLPFSTLKVSFPALSNPANAHRSQALTPEQFHYAFTNNLNEEQSFEIYERYAVPGPDHVLFQAAFANFNPHAPTAVNFANETRAPLLFIAGELDHVSPPAVVKSNFNLYQKSTPYTEYREFPGRTHFILGQPGWEEVADFALGWCEQHAGESATATAARVAAAGASAASAAAPASSLSASVSAGSAQAAPSSSITGPGSGATN